MAKKYNLVSFFSGGGGFDLGFKEAGFNILFSSDIMLDAKKTHDINWPDQKFLLENIENISMNLIKDLIGKNIVDIVIGGPPCQGFSNMGAKHGADPRNLLIDNYLKIISYINPKSVLIENVPGLKTKYKGTFYNKIISGLGKNGYKVYEKILNANDYGVPQLRNRIFIFATKIESPFHFPKPNKESVSFSIPCIFFKDKYVCFLI